MSDFLPYVYATIHIINSYQIYLFYIIFICIILEKHSGKISNLIGIFWGTNSGGQTCWGKDETLRFPVHITWLDDRCLLPQPSTPLYWFLQFILFANLGTKYRRANRGFRMCLMVKHSLVLASAANILGQGYGLAA